MLAAFGSEPMLSSSCRGSGPASSSLCMVQVPLVDIYHQQGRNAAHHGSHSPGGLWAHVAIILQGPRGCGLPLSSSVLEPCRAGEGLHRRHQEGPLPTSLCYRSL